MTRVLQVVAALKKNGTETFIMNIFRNIDRKNFMFDFLIFSDEKEGFYNEILELGGNIYHIPSRRDSWKEYHHQLDVFFSKHATKYDAVHMHGMSLTSLAPLYYAKKHGIKKRIFHIHASNCDGLHNKILHYLNQTRISHLATHFLGCSNQAVK